jgi:hypothetical protein
MNRRRSLLSLWFAMIVAVIVGVAQPKTARAQSAATIAELSRAARDLVTEAPDGRPLTIPSLPAGYTVERRGSATIAYPPALASSLRNALNNVDRDLQSLREQFGLAALPPLEIRLVPDPDTMRALAPQEAPPPAYAVGVAYPSLRLTLVSTSAPRTWEAADVRRVLRHELSHLLLAVASNNAPMPRWFSEGVAIEQAGEHSFERFEELARASVTRSLIPLAELDRAFGERSGTVDLAYAQSADFVGFLLKKDGHVRLGVFAAHARNGVPFEESVRRTWAMSLRSAEQSWKEDVANRHLLLPFVLGGGVLWGGASVLLVVAFIRARRRGRKILARWAAEDARADAHEAAMRQRTEAATHTDDVASTKGAIVVYLPYARKKADELPN